MIFEETYEDYKLDKWIRYIKNKLINEISHLKLDKKFDKKLL